MLGSNKYDLIMSGWNNINGELGIGKNYNNRQIKYKVIMTLYTSHFFLFHIFFCYLIYLYFYTFFGLFGSSSIAYYS